MKKPSGSSVFLAIVALFCMCSQGSSTANAQTSRSLARSLTREDPKLLEVFESLTGSAVASTVKIQAGSRQIAVGTIVDAEGLVLTKASEMRGDLKCRLPSGELTPASVLGIDVENDLALLKIDAEGLSVAPLNPVAPPTRGSWLVSPTDQNGSLMVGVVGVDEREIPPSRAFIGIQMLDKNNDGGVLITEVLENTPAKQARLRAEDVIVKLDDFKIKNRSELVEAIGKYTPGSEVALTIKRKDKDVVVKLTLADAKVTSPMNSRSRTQNSMGSRLSRRGTNFPRAFQHDMALNAKECGGPVVDLDGQIVGINIARSGRVSSLAIPVDVVLSVIERLKSGEYSPVKVYADRIESSEEELASMQAKLADNEKTVAESLQAAKDSQAKIEELERMKIEITKRIREVYEERDRLKKTKRVVESKTGEVERSIRRIQRRLEALRAGKKY